MDIQALFENRSGRVIAVFRAMLAGVFFVAFLVEPIPHSPNLILCRALLGAYLAVSLAMVAVAWRSWWYDHLLARAMLALDVLVFLVAVFATEGLDADFTSPFLAMFALAILSAAFRWDWRSAARTGLIVTSLYVVCGALVQQLGLPLDTLRFARRTFYMLALMFVLVWFGIQRREARVASLVAPLDNTDVKSLLSRVAGYAAAAAGASHAAVAWRPDEEPWVHLHLDGPDLHLSERTGPGSITDWDGREPGIHLFDLSKGRKLVLDHAGRPRAVLLRGALSLAERSGLAEGLAIPFAGASGAGQIVLGGIAGMCADHLILAKAMAREVAGALDRLALARLERETLVTRTRGSIARDLHDSVAQSLAGACFRLEALRRSVHEGPVLDAPAAEQEIVTVRDALRREQGHIRSLIDSLRLREPPPELRDLSQDINAALGDAGAHWGLDTALDAPGSMPVPGWVSHELQQLVREAVANAARHGQAGRVALRMALAEGRLALHILDDGTGFDAAANSADPWSIGERVAALGGELFVESGAAGTRLAIALPASLVTGAAA